MSIQKKLEKLIQNEVLIEIEDYIDELFELIASKKDSINVKEELETMKEMKKDFELMLEDIKSGEMDDEEAQEILEEIIEMRKEEE